MLAIARYIARDRPIAAQTCVDRLVDRAELASETPWAGRVVPEFGRKDIREVFLRSYRIMYRVEREFVLVLTVFEGHRQMGDIDPDAEK